MAGNRVVARFRDGKRIKGLTTDFVPTRDFFHVSLDDGTVVTVRHLDLKAVFFVRDFAGDPSHRRTNEFPADRPVSGRKIRVVFSDGEILIGDGWSMRVRLDEEALKSIAEITRGEYFYAGTAQDLKGVYESLTSKLVLETRETEITAIFVVFAVLAALMSALLSMLWFNKVL